MSDPIDRMAEIAAAIEATMARLEVFNANLVAERSDVLGAVDKLRTDLHGMRADMIERMDRLQNGIADIRHDVFVGFNSTEGVRRANDNTREDLRSLQETVAALYRKLNALETRVREITGDP